MTCPLCSSKQSIFIQNYRYHNEFFANTTIQECQNCSLNFADPLPSEKEWEKFNHGYFDNAHGGVGVINAYEDYNIGVAKVRCNALIEFLEVNQIEVSSVLEVGPGPGYLMRQWLRHYPDTKYHVIESDPSVHGTLEKYGATIIDPTKSHHTKDHDLLIATHVLEHTLDPVSFLKSLSVNLRRGGGVFIETPCLDHLYKDIPEPHTLFFNKATHHRCFSQSGLSVTYQTYNGDEIGQLKFRSLIKKIVAKFQKVTGIPFLKILPSVYPNSVQYGLTENEAAAIVETAPHKVKVKPARWVRSFGIKP